MDSGKTTTTALHVIEDDPIKDFHLDYTMLQRVIRWNCEHNPRFKGTTAKDRARLCGISETTYNTIVSGKNTKPRIDILFAIVSSFNGYIDPLVGLAPERDLDREKEHFDATFMETAQWQRDKAETELAEKREEIGALKIKLTEAQTECRALDRELKEAQKLNGEIWQVCEALRRDLRGHRIFSGIITAIVIAILLFVVLTHQ